MPHQLDESTPNPWIIEGVQGSLCNPSFAIRCSTWYVAHQAKYGRLPLRPT